MKLICLCLASAFAGALLWRPASSQSHVDAWPLVTLAAGALIGAMWERRERPL